jgi:divalent metal cation (Fe/Co/Zn/Cd) transporter
MLIRIKAFIMTLIIMGLMFLIVYSITLYPMAFLKTILFALWLFLFSVIYMGLLNKFKRLQRKKSNKFFNKK